MARFLEEAKKELEGEIERSKSNKPKQRKAKTPPAQSSSVTASTRSIDYPVVRLAPHKHILGRLVWFTLRATCMLAFLCAFSVGIISTSGVFIESSKLQYIFLHVQERLTSNICITHTARREELRNIFK